MKELLHYLLGKCIQNTGKFPGKNSRLIPFWLSTRNTETARILDLTPAGKLLCDFSIPYECMVWLGQEESDDLDVLKTLLKPGDKFIDCGANIGLWSLTASARVGSSGLVFALEPNPSTARKLKHNIQLSKFTNTTVIEAAAGQGPGQLLLQQEQEHNISRIVECSNDTTVAIPVIAIDSLVGNNKIAGIKIDVEGFELAVLKGAQTLLSTQRPWLCVEFNSLAAGTQYLRDWTVHAFLSEHGYVPRLFRDANDKSSTTILTADFSCSGYCNLFYSNG